MKGNNRRQKRRQVAKQARHSPSDAVSHDPSRQLASLALQPLPMDARALPAHERLYRALELIGYDDSQPPEDRLELALAIHALAETSQDQAMMAACTDLAETIRRAEAA